jgi:hypothetical protein
MDPVHRKTCFPADVLCRPLGYLANLGRRFTGQDFYTKPRLKLVFFRPNKAHGFSGISFDHFSLFRPV